MCGVWENTTQTVHHTFFMNINCFGKGKCSGSVSVLRGIKLGRDVGGAVWPRDV